MGCQADKEHLPTFRLLLTRTSLKPIDDFYDEVERTMYRVQGLSESIEIVIDKFASATGLYGPPHRSIAFGILSFLISLLASVKNDTMVLNLHFSDYVPGIVLQESDLDSSHLIAYHSWVELIEFLEAAVEHLQLVAPRMGECLVESRHMLEKVNSMPESQDLRPIDYRKLEKTIDDNFEAIKDASEQLQILIVKVKDTILEAVTTIEEVGRLTDLSQLMKLSRKAVKLGLETVPDVMREFGFQLDQMVKEHRKVITGGHQ